MRHLFIDLSIYLLLSSFSEFCFACDVYVHHYQEKLANRRGILMALVERFLIGELLVLSLSMLEYDEEDRDRDR